jgi:hypothetical protein
VRKLQADKEAKKRLCSKIRASTLQKSKVLNTSFTTTAIQEHVIQQDV